MYHNSCCRFFNRICRKMGNVVLFILIGIAFLICGSSILAVYMAYRNINSMYGYSDLSRISIFAAVAVAAITFQPLLMILWAVVLALFIALSIPCGLLVYIFKKIFRF